MKSLRVVVARLGMLCLCAWFAAACTERAAPQKLPMRADASVQATKEIAPPKHPKRLYARKFVAKVRMEPSLDAAQLGYLRAGTILTAKTAEPVGHDRCLRGWYEIAETGGFVCDGREVIAFEGARPPDRVPTPADRSAALPYRYAYNRVAGTPMYKRLPSEEEALFWEDGILPADASLPELGLTEEPMVADAGEPESERPATLAELQGERGALVRRRLAKGFHVSLDRDFETTRRRYWRTLSNGYIPYERMTELPGSSFHGMTAPSLPMAFVVVGGEVETHQRNERGRLRSAGKLAYHSSFSIRGERTIAGRRYLVAALDGREPRDEMLVRADQVTVVDATLPPPSIRAGERWIDVDLDHQTLVAYEGEAPVYVTLVSTGRVRNEKNPLLNHETPAGVYRILSKHTSATMDGDHALHGAYSLEDVPYVQFFKGAYALHGAFWHDRFGRPSSHGCINLAPQDARWLFDWTSPEVPRAFHASYPVGSAGKGTVLVIRGTTPRG